jgi:adenylate cyclase
MYEASHPTLKFSFRSNLTLGQVFALSLIALTAALGALFYVVYDGSRATITSSSERLRDAASREISHRVSAFLGEAPSAVGQFQKALRDGLANPRDPASVETALFAMLLANDHFGELTFTYAGQAGFDKDGWIELDDSPRGQVSVIRTEPSTGEERLVSRHVHQQGGEFVLERWERGDPAHLQKRQAEGGVSDPTTHPTFTTPAKSEFRGESVWSDLHWSQLDTDKPEGEGRVEVSVQKALMDSAGKFAGVIRIGLLTAQLDRLVEVRLAREGEVDPHRIFICDSDGRLITRLSAADRVQEIGDDLRIAPAAIPGEIARALQDPMMRPVAGRDMSASGSFQANGENYLATFRGLPEPEDWVIGIVVPQKFYLGELVAIRDRLLLISLVIMLSVLAGGGLLFGVIRRAQSQVVRESLKMNAFEFAPASTASPLRDMREVLESLEKAKTAMRAMSKYVPIDLVRRLFRESAEPTLGGEMMNVSIMFTDVAGFTSFAERHEPDGVAEALGRYLEVMTRIIQQETRGTIDKYIGDAIMTLWNAPEPVPHHARMACLAALRCRDAGRELAHSPEWSRRGMPPFETRFGIHVETAMVGHFGAPDRMNYTAIGDAINLASRLEGLNKVYCTTIIASDTIVVAAEAEFDFRLLDVVAVKGKSRATRIYELLGRKGEASGMRRLIVDYEGAFAAYTSGAFSDAIPLLEQHPEDGPSCVLLERCREYLEEPPPSGWIGVYEPAEK